MSAAARGAIAAAAPAPMSATSRSARWWPLAAAMLLAAALRLSTLDLQSFWYDEAFTPVHVLHASLWATLRSVAHTENTPPLWYLIAWADARVLGSGEIALRLPSALAGIATVPVAWAIGCELAGRRAAIACAVLVAVNPLFVWYSQEARAYGLFVLTGALAMLCFLRAMRAPTRARMAAFALSGSLALLSHYFAVFLLVGMVAWLAWEPRTRRAALPAIAALVLVGAALVPLIVAQGGHGTQWIGEWPLTRRLEAIPQYYLTGYSGLPLGRGIELLVALPILAGVALGLSRSSRESAPAAGPHAALGAAPEAAPAAARGALVALSIAACGVLIPIALVAVGADYLAPRNLVAAMIPVTAVIAVVSVSSGGVDRAVAGADRAVAGANRAVAGVDRAVAGANRAVAGVDRAVAGADRAVAGVDRARGGAGPTRARAAAAILATIALAFLAVTIDVDASPRLQRGDWRDLARELSRRPGVRAITTVQLGSAPLEYYLPGFHELAPGSSVVVSEIDETGYAPLRASAAEPPAPGFRLLDRLDVNGLIAYRFLAPAPRRVTEATLRRHVITLAGAAVLAPANAGAPS
jgi:Dolichyl-phosphate-mannose-protein mannosyltransferase